MFTADQIQSRVRGRPFEPLRIVTSAGQTFDIYHPDLIMVGQRDLIVGQAGKKNPGIYQQVSRIAIMHITALEDLPPTAPPQGNGEQ